MTKASLNTHIWKAQNKSILLIAGVPDDVIQQTKDLKTITEIVQTGNHFVITMTTGPSVLRNEFTIGKEVEMDSLTGKVKVRTPTGGVVKG